MKRRIFAFALTLVMLLSLLPAGGMTASAASNVKGDVDFDGAITGVDYVLIRRSILGLAELDANASSAADIDGDNAVTGADYVRVRRHILGLELIVTPSTPEGINFLPGVRQRNGSFNWQTSGEYTIVPSGEPAPVVGEIITFGTETAIKVATVQQVNGQTMITYTRPELYEILDSINVEGTGAMDFSQFVAAPGVTVISGGAGTYDIRVDDTIAVNIAESFGDSIDLGNNWELSFNMGFNCPNVKYKIDVDFGIPLFGQRLVDVRDAYIEVENSINFHMEIGSETSNSDHLEKRIPIGHVPVLGVPGIAVEVQVDLVFTASGKFMFDYNIVGILGVRVLNNRPMNITRYTPTTSVGLAASVSGGAELALAAEIFGYNLLSAGVEAGIAASGEVDVRSTGIICMDATVNPFIKAKVLQNTVLDEWLDIGMEWELLSAINSPLQFTGHWENLERVDECTFTKGTIKGTVKDGETSQRIQGAMIAIEGESEPIYSDANGEYTAYTDSGSHVIRISADGYIPFESVETVLEGDVTYLQTYLMVEGEEGSDETGIVGGRITNAVNGISVPNAVLTVRKGWNTTSGDVVATDQANSEGVYQLTLPLGNYTVSLEHEGYLPTSFNVVVTHLQNQDCHASMVPDGESGIPLGDLRVILRWGDTPRDLDSHLIGPTADGEGIFHTWYADMNSYYDNGDVHAFLDMDDTSSYGPETSTVYNITANGVYSFYVHDYTNSHEVGCTQMANSGANVQVLIGDTEIAHYYIPTSGSGNVWHVFDFDAANGVIHPVNVFSDTSDPSSVGTGISTFGFFDSSYLKDYELEELETEPEEVTEPEVPTESEAATEPEVPTESEAATEPEAPTESEAATEPEAPTESEATTEPEAPTESEAATEPEAPTETEAATEPEATTETEAATEPEATTETEAATEPEAPTESETATEPVSEPGNVSDNME